MEFFAGIVTPQFPSVMCSTTWPRGVLMTSAHGAWVDFCSRPERAADEHAQGDCSVDCVHPDHFDDGPPVRLDWLMGFDLGRDADDFVAVFLPVIL